MCGFKTTVYRWVLLLQVPRRGNPPLRNTQTVWGSDVHATADSTVTHADIQRLAPKEMPGEASIIDYCFQGPERMQVFTSDKHSTRWLQLLSRTTEKGTNQRDFTGRSSVCVCCLMCYRILRGCLLYVARKGGEWEIMRAYTEAEDTLPTWSQGHKEADELKEQIQSGLHIYTVFGVELCGFNTHKVTGPIGCWQCKLPLFMQ